MTRCVQLTWTGAAATLFHPVDSVANDDDAARDHQACSGHGAIGNKHCGAPVALTALHDTKLYWLELHVP